MAGRAAELGLHPDAARLIANTAYVFLYPLVVNYGAAYEAACADNDGALWAHRFSVRVFQHFCFLFSGFNRAARRPACG